MAVSLSGCTAFGAAKKNRIEPWLDPVKNPRAASS